jgi:drug/metabolite transporter (DMT)-like permease
LALADSAPEAGRFDASAATRAQALAVLVLGACALAFTPIFMRLSGVDPSAAGFWRLAFALPFMALPLAFPATRGGLGRPSLLLLGAGLFFALDLGFWHTGVKLTSVANATTLGNLSQVFVVVGAWILFRERPRGLFLAGLALALAGVWIMASARGGARGIDPLTGDLMSIAGAFWYGCYFLTVRRARGGVSATGVMVWTSLTGAPLLLGAAVLMGEKIIPTSAGGWAACVGMGFVHFLGQGAIAWALGRLPAATAAVVILLQPVIAAVLGLGLFGEGLGAMQIAGGLTALVGVVLAQLAASRVPSRAKAAS